MKHIQDSIQTWFLTLLSFVTLMTFVTGQITSAEIPASSYITALIIAYGMILIRQVTKDNLLEFPWVLILVSIYAIGGFLVGLFKEDVLQELPRSIVMLVSVWTGLMMGVCIGKCKYSIQKFAKTILVFGVTISLFSIFTGIGLEFGLTSLSIGRQNRLWTIAFGIIDPVSMLAAGVYLLQQKKYKDFKEKFSIQIFISISILFVLFSSTRSFLIEITIIILLAMISKTTAAVRSILITSFSAFTVVLIIATTQLQDASNIGILDNFGFVDERGKVVMSESRRSVLTEYQITQTLSSPWVGVGMNKIKEGALQIEEAAKSEYGYPLHMASFGILVATPFYIVMFFGGLVQPLIKIMTLPQEKFNKISAIYGMAISSVLAGFNGYYGQATSIAQFICLIWIGIATSVNESDIAM
jgi:hypothetical protein